MDEGKFVCPIRGWYRLSLGFASLGQDREGGMGTGCGWVWGGCGETAWTVVPLLQLSRSLAPTCRLLRIL